MKNMCLRSNKCRAGMTLIETIVGMVVLGLILVLLIQFSGNISNLIGIAKKKSSRDSMIRFLVNELDCSQTYADKPTCDGTTEIVVKSQKGIPITSSMFKDKWQVSFFCDNNGLITKIKNPPQFPEWEEIITPHLQNFFGFPQPHFCYYYAKNLPPLVTIPQNMQLITNDGNCDRLIPNVMVTGGRFLYRANATCPTNYQILSGGTICEGNSVVLTSQPSDDQKSWTGTCCAEGNPHVGKLLVTAKCYLNID